MNKIINKKHCFPVLLCLFVLVAGIVNNSCTSGKRHFNKSKKAKLEKLLPNGRVTFGFKLPKETQIFNTRYQGPDVATHITRHFDPEIIENIKKLGFKNEAEYRKQLLASLGVEDEKSAIILQKTYNGIPGVSVLGGKGISGFHTRRQDFQLPEKSLVEVDPAQVRAKLDKIFQEIEARSKLSNLDIKVLVEHLNKATRAGLTTLKYHERFKNIIKTKYRRE